METKVLSSGLDVSNLPQRLVSERPRLSEVLACENVPVIDLSSQDRSQIVQQIEHACKSGGFFQVTNHGVSMEPVEKMLGVAHEFFSPPVEEKMKLYSDDLSKTMRLSTNFNLKETVHNWRDYLRLHDYPLDEYMPEWPSDPSSFKEIVQNYGIQVRELGFRVQELISESLGLDKDYIKSVLGEQGQHMAVNYYPPCPEPELTYGLPGHTDPNALTILLQDLQVAGLRLQVLKEGKWVAVNPQPNAFVVNQETVHKWRDYLRVRCWRELSLIPFSFKGGEISFKRVLFNQIKLEQLKPGDHIYSWRRGYLYAHHGIYAGGKTVIHYTKGAGQEIGKARTGDHPSKHNGVISSSLDCFLSGGKLYRFEYGVSLVLFVAKARGGTSTIASSDQPEVVLRRAKYLLQNGFGGYNLLNNNCEDFAIYCKTGLLVQTSIISNRSGQVASVFGAINAIQPGLAASLCAAINVLSYGLLGCGLYFATRYFSDVGVRRNVIKVPVERLVTCTDDLIPEAFVETM